MATAWQIRMCLIGILLPIFSKKKEKKEKEGRRKRMKGKKGKKEGGKEEYRKEGMEGNERRKEIKFHINSKTVIIFLSH